MMIRLKQALGRTSRRPNQKSAALILDTRLLEKSYGPSSLEILRKTHQVWIEKNDKILSDILDFLL